MTDQKFNLIIEDGVERGREITVKAEGARIGRSSSNDIVIKDPALSRYHCRIFFKPGDGLWAEDLGSANQALLNKKPLTESRILPGDRLTLGDTTMLVLSDECLTEDAVKQKLPDLAPQTPASARLSDIPVAPISNEPAQPAQPGSQTTSRSGLPRLSLILIAMAACLGLIVLLFLFRDKLRPKPEASQPAQPHVTMPEMVLTYEKIQASTMNIFRYALDLRNKQISAEVDDIENSTHIQGNQRIAISDDSLNELREAIEKTDFFRMPEITTGQERDLWIVMDLSITDGARCHHVRLVNVIEPEQFKTLRTLIEDIATRELGVTADPISKADRLDRAGKAILRGRDLYDQRQIKHENLFYAIRALREAETYLDPISEKPPDYKEMIALAFECKTLLDDEVKTLKFEADQAIRNENWALASEKLSVIIDMIPDSGDDSNAYATKRLFEIQRRIKK